MVWGSIHLQIYIYIYNHLEQILESNFLETHLSTTWWLIPLSKWVITPVINGISRVNPLITGVITHLLSGMNHQVVIGRLRLSL